MNIYINNIAKWRVDKYTFSDNQLDVRSISMTVTHPSSWIGENAPAVADFTDAYVLYKGERFELTVSSPTAEKNTSSIDYKYELIFKGVEEELSRRKVRDLAKIGESNFVAQGTSFILSGDAQQFKQLIENNLKYYFNGDWTISLLENPGNDLYSFAKIAVDNMSIWELLGKTYEYYGLRWKIKNKEIIIGYTPDVVEHIFDYGKDGGLVKITRTKQDENTINRLIAVGSSRNIPLNYFTDRYDKFPKDPNPISSVVNIRNLMPKVFRDSVKAGAPPYIDYVEDSVLVAKDGVRESIESPNEDIYPSISKVEVAGIGRIDQIVASEIPTTDSSSDNGYSQTFDIWIKDIGFDLIDDKYTSTQDAKISFTSGELSGYEFTILATGGVRHVSEDTSKSHNGVQSKYRITLIKSDEDYDATGRMLPNTVLYPKVYADGSADSFVIYDIEMPQVYVELAEERLEAWMNERLDKLKIEKPTYAIEIMDSFFATATIESDNKKIEDKIIAGNKVKINNTNVTNGVQELFISNVKVDYKGILPKYFITITDKLGEDRGVISRIENTINKVSNNQQVDKQEIKSNLHTHANKMVLDLFKQDSKSNVYLENSFYSLGGLSTFGFSEVGDGNGGGGIINVIDNLTSTSKTDPLSANMGRYLKTLIDNIEVGEGGQVIVDWEAITGKPTTFVPSAHTHIIGDVTGLQGALDDKASLSQLDDKEDKFTKNSAFNKNFGTGLNDVARGNHTHTFASLTSIPTTLAGYGITDGANKVHTHSISDVTNLQTELDKKATNTALTTHVNKTDNPHSVTKSQVGLGNVANKDLSNVDNIQQATKTEFTSHKNLFDSMFRKVGTNIEAKLSLYSLGGLSAYGFSDEGSGGNGGGGIVNILSSWANYTSDKSGWALSAGLGVDLNTRKADKTWVESLLEDYVPTDTKYTAGRGLTLTGTVFSTSFDIANYATVTALGGKVDKVAGKSLISDTEIARLANVTNQDISGKADKATTLSGYGITDAYTKTNIDTLLSGKENAFTKNSAFNKNFGTIVGTVAQGNHSHNYIDVIDSRNLPGGSINFNLKPNEVSSRAIEAYYGIIGGLSGSKGILTVSGWGSNYESWQLIGGSGVSASNDNFYLRSGINDTWRSPVEIYHSGNHRSNSENDTRYKAPFDSFKTTFDTMFRKTSTNEIEAKLSLYTLGGLSAYGFSDEGSSGGGGGIVNILSDWAIYDASKSGWALGAGLGKGLYDNKADKTDPRFTDARTPLAHSHVISDITGLQGALNSKLETSIFNTHNNDNIRHITGAERTKWNGVVTDFGNLEIGGRNLLLNSNFKTTSFNGWQPNYGSHQITENGYLKTYEEVANAARIEKAFTFNGVGTFTFSIKVKTNRAITWERWEGLSILDIKIEQIEDDFEIHSITFSNSTVGIKTIRGYQRNAPIGTTTLIEWEQIKKGNKATDWTPAPEDQVSDWATTNVNSFSYIKNKPTKLSQFSNVETAFINKTQSDGWYASLTNFNSHVNNKSNPHNVTTAQIGAVDLTTNQTIGGVKSYTANAKFTTIEASGTLTALGGNSTNWNKVYGDFNEMFRKVGTSIEAKLPIYSLGGLSAYGFSDEGTSSGGGIVNILSEWTNYDTSKSGWALSAGLGENLRTRVVTLENAEIDLSGYATLNYVNDKVKTDVPLNAKFTDTIVDISGKVDKATSLAGYGITDAYTKTNVNDLLSNKADKATKITAGTGLTGGGTLASDRTLSVIFGTTANTIAQGNDSRINNGQTAFEWGNHASAGYALNSAFNTHNNDNIRHITGVERTKWDKVVTDFDGLEIGGRNLLLDSKFIVGDTEAKNWERGGYNTVSIVEGVARYTVHNASSAGRLERVISLEKGVYTVSVKAKTNAAPFNWETYSLINAQLVSEQYQLITDNFSILKWTFEVTGTAIVTLRLYYGDSLQINDYIDVEWYKLEKGTKATDWTPAPEDQVSDWATTDVNSFSFIKNKPTLLSQFTDNIGVATHIANTSNPHSVTKAQVGLEYADNTSDLNKPISNATQNALNTKVSKSGDTMSGALNIVSEIASGSRLNIKRTGSNYNAVVSFENSSGILTIGRTTDVFAVGEGDIYSEANRWLTVSKTAVTASQNVNTPKVSFGNGWTAEGVGSELQFKLNGVIQAKIVNGALVSTGGVTAYQ